MLIGLFGDFYPTGKKRPGPFTNAVTRIENGVGRGLFIRQAFMPAQPELLLTAKRIDVAGFGEVGGSGVQSKS